MCCNWFEIMNNKLIWSRRFSYLIAWRRYWTKSARTSLVFKKLPNSQSLPHPYSPLELEEARTNRRQPPVHLGRTRCPSRSNSSLDRRRVKRLETQGWSSITIPENLYLWRATKNVLQAIDCLSPGVYMTLILYNKLYIQSCKQVFFMYYSNVYIMYVCS